MNNKLIRHFLYPLHEKLRGRSTYRFLDRFRDTEKLSPQDVRALQGARGERFLQRGQSAGQVPSGRA